MASTRIAGTRSALNGAATELGAFGMPLSSSSTTIAMKAIVISTAVPKKGACHSIWPSRPPISGPTAMPSPSAASYRMIAGAVPPRAEATIEARAVEMNRAFPRPQNARQTISHSMVGAKPAAVLASTMIARPVSRVALVPMRVETQLVKNIAMPVITR